MGMRMYKRCRDGEVEPRKKKKEGVEDGDEEEEVFYGTESGPRRDEQGRHSIALIMSTLNVFMFP